MSERALVTIRQIADIRPIPDADMIVCVVIDGWELVTQKSNNFKVGDLVVYFEIDSVLPERPEFEFLRDRCYVNAQQSVNGPGFRLKTIRLKGQVSQGLILPLSELGEGSWEVGQDITDHLGVVKFERPISANLAGVARGNFPVFIPKTDQERVQNCYRYINTKWAGHQWEVTMKLDGSSFTAYYDAESDRFGVCSCNLDLKEVDGNAFWSIARKYNLESKLRSLGKSIAIQGELVGPGIQGNKDNFVSIDMYVFDIYDINKRAYLPAAVRRILTADLGLQHVPVLHNGISLQNMTLPDLIEMAEGPSINAKLREGIVLKSLNHPNTSFKVISNRWLLKHGE
jgi:RNA ligase (TIGR02306 family)